MTRKFQFVAVLLAVVIAMGAFPLSARCYRAQSQRQEPCPPNCPMMMMMMGGATTVHGTTLASLAATGVPQRANCCNLSTSIPEVFVQLQPPSGTVDLTIAEQAWMPALESLHRVVKVEVSSFHAPGRSALCTFRI